MKLINAGLLLLGGAMTFGIGCMLSHASSYVDAEIVSAGGSYSNPAYVVMVIGASVIAYSVVLIMRTLKR